MLKFLKSAHIGNWFKKIKPHRILCKKKKHAMALPDFLIIGAQKSGTSALYHNLNRHPSIYLPTSDGKIEIQFFNNEKNWQRGVNWYKSHFTQSDCLQGEKTPEYLFFNKCHKRMHRIVPNAKLIILLRNPVDRAYSHWNHFNQDYEQSKHWGWKIVDFETAVTSHRDMIKRGEYIDQIGQLLTFYDKSQIHISIAERMKKDPVKEIGNVFSFLDISHVDVQYQNNHVRVYPEPMKKDIRKHLLEYYQPFNARLFDFLGYSVPEWEK